MNHFFFFSHSSYILACEETWSTGIAHLWFTTIITFTGLRTLDFV